MGKEKKKCHHAETTLCTSSLFLGNSSLLSSPLQQFIPDTRLLLFQFSSLAATLLSLVILRDILAASSTSRIASMPLPLWLWEPAFLIHLPQRQQLLKMRLLMLPLVT